MKDTKKLIVNTDIEIIGTAVIGLKETVEKPIFLKIVIKKSCTRYIPNEQLEYIVIILRVLSLNSIFPTLSLNRMNTAILENITFGEKLL